MNNEPIDIQKKIEELESRMDLIESELEHLKTQVLII